MFRGCRTSNTGYIVGDNGVILKTGDSGTTWITLTSGTNTRLYAVCFIDAMTGYIAGDAGIILKTEDAGSTWSRQLSGTQSSLFSVYFAGAGTGYAVGDAGIILKTTNGGVWIPENLATGRLTIYPDPAKDFIRIGTTPGNQGTSTVAIYDPDGREVIMLQSYCQGTLISVSTLLPGLYVVMLVAGDHVFSGKFIRY